jgi:hypothetical protein
MATKTKTSRLDADGLNLRESLFVRFWLSNGGNGKDASEREVTSAKAACRQQNF